MGVIEEIKRRIVVAAEPDRIILFGSRATGRARSGSDYDICVIKSGVDRRRELAGRIYEALIGIPAPVDVIVETPERFDEMKGDKFMVYREIARHGRVIYEKRRARR